MKNIFKFMGVAILGIFGLLLNTTLRTLVVGMISLFFAWQLFQSTLPEMEDWRLRIMQAELDSLKGGLIAYRSLVLRVACRTPNPKVRVQILYDLP